MDHAGCVGKRCIQPHGIVYTAKMDALSSQWFRNWGNVGAHVSRSVGGGVGRSRPGVERWSACRRWGNW